MKSLSKIIVLCALLFACLPTFAVQFLFGGTKKAPQQFDEKKLMDFFNKYNLGFHKIKTRNENYFTISGIVVPYSHKCSIFVLEDKSATELVFKNYNAVKQFEKELNETISSDASTALHSFYVNANTSHAKPSYANYEKLILVKYLDENSSYRPAPLKSYFLGINGNLIDRLNCEQTSK